MSRSRWTAGVALATWAGAFALLALGNACSVDSGAISPLALPDKDQFITQGVDTFMQRRCGTLDCHGQAGRPLRIYSPNGLRLNDGPNGTRDNRGIQPNESAANYYSVVGLEPEEISLCLTTQGAFTDFLLLKKPLGIDQGGVRHKGGSVLRSTDTGFDCLIGWASGQVDPLKCADAVMQ
ncbi:MAG: hypothetical protein QOI41_118 [Myxococcales bacterium]|jgi:hypothetical protein|nr:hypothetical protein [Myxococcales bacterium]